MVNYPGFDGPNGELKALYEFITENNINYKWIGMNCNINNINNNNNNNNIFESQSVALILNSI